MTGATLRDAICASRSGEPTEEKRAYLQLDDSVEVSREDTRDESEYRFAL